LGKVDVTAVTMHGGRSQNQRTKALKAFSSGKAQALVATDVAARGIHVEDVTAVVHYDVAADPKDYLHRSGRTARAGAAGVVITLVSEGQDPAVRRIIRDLGLDARIESPATIGPAATTNGSRRRDERSPGDDRQTARGQEPRSLYVGNLPWKATVRDLEELFSGHGKVERASISRHPKTGRSKGFGFVDIVERQSGTASALDGSTLGGRVLRVRAAR
jgi:superfamily II DNA/RNA helicase